MTWLRSLFNWLMVIPRAFVQALQSDFPPYRFSLAKMSFAAACVTIIWAVRKSVIWALSTPAPDPTAESSRLSFVYDLVMVLAITFCAAKVAGLAIGHGAGVAKTFAGRSKDGQPNNDQGKEGEQGADSPEGK